MSLGEHGDEHGDEATQGMSFLSPPTGRQKRHSHSPATTPMSVGTSPRISSKRPRMSNDWIEDEVHPVDGHGDPGQRWNSSEAIDIGDYGEQLVAALEHVADVDK